MEIKIIETGKMVNLNIIDPRSGCNWINDLMGNHGELPPYDEDNNYYIMSQDDYNWWHDLTTAYQKADYRYDSLTDVLMGDEYLNLVNDYQNLSYNDLEDYPSVLNELCEKYEKV